MSKEGNIYFKLHKLSKKFNGEELTFFFSAFNKCMGETWLEEDTRRVMSRRFNRGYEDEVRFSEFTRLIKDLNEGFKNHGQMDKANRCYEEFLQMLKTQNTTHSYDPAPPEDLLFEEFLTNTNETLDLPEGIRANIELRLPPSQYNQLSSVSRTFRDTRIPWCKGEEIKEPFCRNGNILSNTPNGEYCRKCRYRAKITLPDKFELNSDVETFVDIDFDGKINIHNFLVPVMHRGSAKNLIINSNGLIEVGEEEKFYVKYKDRKIDISNIKLNHNRNYVINRLNNGIIISTGFVIQKGITTRGLNQIALIMYDDGNIYIGHLMNGKKTQQGIMIYTNGDIYQGNWFQNKKYGRGNLFDVDGNVSEGEWENDKRIN